MTRNIKKDTPVQVNSNLIGVQVRPDTGSIDVDYTIPYVRTNISTPTVPMNISFVLEDGEGGKEYAYDSTYKGSVEVVDGETVYTYYRFPRYNDYPENQYLYAQVPGLDIDTVMYIGTSEIVDDQEVWTMTRFGQVTNLYNATPGATVNCFYGIFRFVDSENLSCSVTTYDPTMDLPYFDMDGMFYLDTDNGFVYDYDNNNLFGVTKNGVRNVTGVELSAELQDESTWEGKYEWKGIPTGGSPYYPEGVEATVWTDNADPAIGAVVYYSSDTPNFNQLSVSSKAPVAADCSVEFSVDGSTWTKVGENLTDDNNVIANIPRYVYLRFGQDVEITEE